MIQGGVILLGRGRGGTSIYGDKFADEIHPDLRFSGAGDTGNGQFRTQYQR